MASEPGLARLPCHDGGPPWQAGQRRRARQEHADMHADMHALGKTGMACRRGPIAVDLVCGAREKPGEPRRIEIVADGEFSLTVVAGAHRVETKIPRGRTTLRIDE